MKTLNKDEKKAVAADIFKRYSKASKVAVTSDGMAFITDESENALLNHSKNNRHKKELEITRFTRDAIESSTVEKSATDLIAEIKSATGVTSVEAYLTAENAGKKRQTVIKAAEAKLKELKSAE